jgi:3-hydroxyacyl-[acyl-carrier-protein] dehydratase
MAEGSKTTSKQPLMGFREIVKVLPHRHPFILVDRVLERNLGPNPASRQGRTIHAIKNVTINEPYFQGHFPHRPVMPAVYMLEVMAQVGALLCYREEDPPQDVAFVGVNEARFRRPVVPGDTLEIKMDCRKDKGPFLIFGGQIFVDGEVVCEAEILAKVFDLDDGGIKV